jgi:hypothetical protein
LARNALIVVVSEVAAAPELVATPELVVIMAFAQVSAGFAGVPRGERRD